MTHEPTTKAAKIETLKRQIAENTRTVAGTYALLPHHSATLSSQRVAARKLAEQQAELTKLLGE